MDESENGVRKILSLVLHLRITEKQINPQGTIVDNLTNF